MPKQKRTPSRPKSLYRVKNWNEYEKALVQRGSITFWMTDDFEKNWRHTGEKQRGSQYAYSDKAIEIMLTVKEVFHLTNRQTEGFIGSLFALMKIGLPVPDHSTLWKVRQHGVSKRRTWRKLHVGVNPQDGEFQAVLLTDNSVSDDNAVAGLLVQIEQELDEFAADGAYDKRKVYDSLNAHSPGVNILIPPRKNARIWKHGNTKAEPLKRDENLRSIRKHGRKAWKKRSGYHIRSLAETAMSRLKTIFGNELSARLIETQTTQAVIRCAALNKMTHLGMPQAYKVV